MLAIGLLIAANAALANAQVFAVAKGEAENVEWKRDGTTFTVTYDLTSSDPSAVFKVTLMASIAGAPFKPVAVSGDIGDKVAAGKGKKIIWKTVNDLDNQDYDLFKFQVEAVSSRLAPVGAPAATNTPPPGIKPLPDMRGTWVGTYADSATAELVVSRQDGAAFTGTLRVAMKAGDTPTEVNVEGTVSADGVELREIAVVQLGSLEKKGWNLGSGSGTLQPDGQQMSGRGKDRRTNYSWTLTRR